MDQIRLSILLRTIVLQCFIMRNVFSIQKREWIDTPTTKLTEGDVTCFSEYMELRIHSASIEALGVWLSGALRIQVNLMSLDHLNLQLSACGFSLHKDPGENFVFTVSYTGCLVQQQHGFNVLTLNLVKSTNRFGGRSHSLVMKCPVVSVQSKVQIQCDPEYIQVIRQVPHVNWDNELPWCLSLSDRLIVALEDASLIQMNIDMTAADITVQGRRRESLSPVKIMEHEGEFLALKLVRGQFAYSMEATCPKEYVFVGPTHGIYNRMDVIKQPMIPSTAETTVLHIFKRCMGLTKRGSSHGETLTVSDVSVNQTENFTVTETSEFVTLTLPTTQILQTKACADSKQLVQPFYRLDVVLTFKETNHKMHWSMENTLPCIARPADTSSHITSFPGPNITDLSRINFRHGNVTAEAPFLDSPAVPKEKLNHRDPFKENTAGFSTTHSPHTQTDGSSFNFNTDGIPESQSGNGSSRFDDDTVASINATKKSFSDFLHAATNTSVEPDFLDTKGTTQASTMSLTTLVPPEQADQQFNISIWNKDQQKQRRLRWTWKD